LARKTVHEIVEAAYNKLVELKPTVEEIHEYADKYPWYGEVTYSISRRGNWDMYFLSYHDTWGVKKGGKVHIDIGYVDPEIKAENDKKQSEGGYRNICDTTHLMLGNRAAPEFIQFILDRRQKLNIAPKKIQRAR